MKKPDPKMIIGHCPCRQGHIIQTSDDTLSIDCKTCSSLFEVKIGSATDSSRHPVKAWYLKLKSDPDGTGLRMSVPDVKPGPDAPTERENAILDYMFRNTHACPFSDDCGLDFDRECTGFRSDGCRKCILKNIVKYGQNSR